MVVFLSTTKGDDDVEGQLWSLIVAVLSTIDKRGSEPVRILAMRTLSKCSIGA